MITETDDIAAAIDVAQSRLPGAHRLTNCTNAARSARAPAGRDLFGARP
jgi:hypothetical protein